MILLPSARMFTANVFAATTQGSDRAVRSRHTRTSGGSSESVVNEFTVMPQGTPRAAR